MSLLASLLPTLLHTVSKAVGKSVEDKDLALKIQAALEQQIMEESRQELEACAKIIVAEAQSESWLTRSWRPITMLVFVTLVVLFWLGFTAPGINETVVSELLEIIKYGISGYIVTRGGEKMVKAWRNKPLE